MNKLNRAFWQDETVQNATAPARFRSLAELTQTYLGETLSMEQLFTLVETIELPDNETASASDALWLGSVGYERHKDSREFAQHLSDAGVQRLIDVRELPISRRRGYAKTALGEAMAGVGIEYVHVKALGNPKAFRDLYKAGNVQEGRRRYEQYLLGEQADALRDLVGLLREKRCALMCVEHDPNTCHRTVIVQALSADLGLQLEVTEIA